MSEILIIEDEKVIRTALRRLLARHGYEVTEAGTVQEAETLRSLNSFDLIISDLRLPDLPGTAVIERASNVPVLIMTSYASVKSAVDAMRLGAADYIAKPFDHDEMMLAVKNLIEKNQAQQQNAALKSDPQCDYPVAGIVGDCPAMQQVFDHIQKVAPTDVTVLILGESGTGKELVARALHEASLRKEASLIAVNCAAIPEDLIESELFGHEKGAFTGAVGAREGLVEAADGGTLFLDEIGELPLVAQARLLRVLQEREVRRVGSARVRKVDLRLIAATHRDLQALVSRGQLRSDLYYRLRVMEIHLPPLRERGDDIDKLANYLLHKTCKRLNRDKLSFAPATIAAIKNYDWPGNIRELENAIERAAILCETASIEPSHLAIPSRVPEQTDTTSDMRSDLSLDDYFLQFVAEHQTDLTETELAKRLGISRKSLWERRQKLGIPRPKTK